MMDRDEDAYIASLYSEIDRLSDQVEAREESIAELILEERRIRWFLSVRLDVDGDHTLLEHYDSLNPDWIDVQFGSNCYEIPPIYKEGYEPQS